jgi:adhesin/invasin
VASVTDSLGGMLGRWTLGQQAGLQSSLAALSGTAPVTFVATGRANGAATATIETGNNQTQTVRQTVPLPLVARVTDSFGNPVAGTAVTWAINQGGGSLLATSATTDSSGRATAIWTLGGTTGSQLATLSVPSLPLVVFSATATAGALDTLAIVAGNNQSGTVSTALGTPLIVRVVDANGNPEVGVSVIFAVVSGGGTVNPAIVATDAGGRATANWTIGGFAGAQTATASAGAKSVTFVATGSAASGGGGGGGVTPAQIVLVSGNGQVGNVGAQLGANVVVKVVDASGVPVSGTTITWTMAGTNAGGFVSPITSLTDGSGQASTIWMLGSKIGLQTLTASVASPALSLQLIATANLGSSGAVLIKSGNNQTAATGATIAHLLYVKVVDQNNKAVIGARVTWAVATGGGGLTQTPNAGITDSVGLDSASWKLGSTVGPQTVTAAVSGVGSITFSATATTVGGTAATIRVISGDGQVGRSQQVLPDHLVVEVRDASGNTLSGISVAFTQDPVKNPDGFTSPTPVTTGADGRATVTWTLGKNVSNTTVPMAVTANPVGLPLVIVTFTATARPEYRIQRITTPSIQTDTTGATIGFPGDYLALSRDTLRVQVYDPTDSSGVQGVSVTWAPQVSGDGLPVNASTVTDNFGYAKTNWVLRDGTGNAIPPSNIAKRMIATASIGQVEFQASVYPGRICSVSQNSISTSPPVGSGLADTVTVHDCNGFAVAGATVTLVASGGGSASPASTTTNTAGQAFTTWTLGTVPGVQTLSATASAKAYPYNAGGDPTFSASNSRLVSVVAGAANTITVAAHPGSAVAGTAVTITVTVTDTYGNVVPGQSVSFAASGGGTPAGAVSSATGTTDSSGSAGVVWTLGGTPGSNTLTVTAGSKVITVTITGT